MPSKKPIKILGLSFFYHDSAAALIIDGKVVAAAQEERFSRLKHDESFPAHAINFCLQFAGLKVSDLDYIVFYEKPILKFERLLSTYIKTWPKGFRSFIRAMQSWFSNKLWVEDKIRKTLDYQGKILFSEHHQAHAASAYYCSDFNEATIITIDGVGEWETTTVGYGRHNQLNLSKTIHFPHSLGLLYSALTYYLGFKVNDGEYKVMGLAPYGQPGNFLPNFKQLITVREDGSYNLNMDYFSFEYGLTMTNNKFNKLFGGPPRQPGSPLEQRHKDIAAALQKTAEETILKIAAYAKQQFPSDNLCLAGGVALNCVANGKILRSGLFKKIYIQPAASDAGGALGAALYVYFHVLNFKRPRDVMPNAFLGTAYSNEAIKTFLDNKLASLSKSNRIIYWLASDQELISEIVTRLKDNQIIGWFQGRMEFGPRALGARSIIADARVADNWQRINLNIKFRESFRPFAPAVLLEETDKYFELGDPSPYMLLTARVKHPGIPAVTHVDQSARIQTVTEQTNGRFYRLIKDFQRLSNCPLIINTSFNSGGEPIAESPADAFDHFLNSQLNCLVLENYIIIKDNKTQP